jgi:hemerythrin
MPLMNWSDDLSVHVKKVDDQHMRLFHLLNKFHDAMKLGKAKDIMADTLSELVDYTCYHFTTEERLFKVYGYPEINEHKREHDALSKQARDLRERFTLGEPILTSITMSFLKNWLNQHIVGSDKKYSAFLNAKGIH